MPFGDGVGFARRLAGDTRTRVPAKFADDSCGDGVLQEDGRRLPDGKRAASVQQVDLESPAAVNNNPADTADPAFRRRNC